MKMFMIHVFAIFSIVKESHLGIMLLSDFIPEFYVTVSVLLFLMKYMISGLILQSFVQFSSLFPQKDFSSSRNPDVSYGEEEGGTGASIFLLYF